MNRKMNKKNEKLRVLVDMDGVLCDFEAHALQTFRKLHPDEPYVELRDRNTFYIKDQYVKKGEHLPALIDNMMRTKDFFLQIPEIDGACEAVKAMSAIDGVEVFICTTPIADSDFCAQEKMEWIKRHLGMAWVNNLIMTHDKTMIKGHLLIDDKHWITGAVKFRSWDHILFDQCHNKHITEFKTSRLLAGANGEQKSSGRSAPVWRLDDWSEKNWKSLIDQYKKAIM